LSEFRGVVPDERNPYRGGPSRAKYRTAALIWAAILLIGSLQPERPGHIHFGIPHHIIHLVGFGALAFLATGGFGRPGRTSLFPAAASFLFGLGIELLQHLQNRAPMEWNDVRDDAVGILAFTLTFHLLYRHRDPTLRSELVSKRASPVSKS
jgi:hypothetical protein